MQAKVKVFEKNLRSKLQQKLKGKETEESFLIKCFKFMDISGTGKVNFDKFSGAIGRMGFAMDKEVIIISRSSLIELTRDIQFIRHR